MSGLSFKFSKSKEKKVLEASAIAAASSKREADEEAGPATEVISGDFVPSKRAKKEDLVIPLITKNRWRVEELRETDVVKAELVTLEETELEKAAKEALLKEGKELGGEAESEASVPLLYANQVPAGMETEGRLDVGLRPDASEDADYDQVPIEDYGMAMLRGMGWREGEGIGRTHKASVQQKIPELRPKGLGLGADKALVTALKSAKTSGQALINGKDKADATLKLGSLVQVTSRGPQQGAYGKVASFDEDNNRVMVKMALGGSTATIPVVGLRIVSAVEYDKESRCINKSKFDVAKEEQRRKHREHVVDEDPLAIRDGDYSAQAAQKKQRRREKSESPEVVAEMRRGGWLRAELRVRVVDKEHPLHLAKVRVVDVEAEGRCSCVTDEGRLVEGLAETQLETVIPRGDGPLHVLLLRGPHQGEAALVLAKDKRRQTAQLQLLRQQEKIVTAHFDDVCHFVGDTSSFDS